ncbi:phage tail protein I [Tissierella sp. MSJ-40]|uniref:Phage tail protein I n=1 Tax=Tissierella simiarum TaxID=2841534 RepID=A0ABS6E617_9FIRM|nr:phage tail protein I [Tissierella simiarum]MBU5438281.1 phage tail protein I [Tissierella simiarum]
MNNTIYGIDLTRMLPPSLKNDEDMLALARVIGDELQKTSRMAQLNIIYARIDELDEAVLDILAYDLHVDWYDYSYPIEAKRALIKDSVKVHKRLGTKFAVETALGNLHPNSRIEEWFQYGGEPFSFRVILDTTRSRIGAGYFEIKKAVDSYKRLSAHMDDVIYQCTVTLVLGIETHAFCYTTGMTGKVLAGTSPQRNIIGAIEETDIELHNDLKGYKFTSPVAGTIPERSTIARIDSGGISQEVTAEGYKYNVKRCGTSICKS